MRPTLPCLVLYKYRAGGGCVCSRVRTGQVKIGGKKEKEMTEIGMFCKLKKGLKLRERGREIPIPECLHQQNTFFCDYNLLLQRRDSVRVQRRGLLHEKEKRQMRERAISSKKKHGVRKKVATICYYVQTQSGAHTNQRTHPHTHTHIHTHRNGKQKQLELTTYKGGLLIRIHSRRLILTIFRSLFVLFITKKLIAIFCCRW